VQIYGVDKMRVLYRRKIRRWRVLLIGILVLTMSLLPFSLTASATHLPNWTYIKVTYCLPICQDYYFQADPIDLIFVGADLTTVANSLLNRGWHSTICNTAEYVFWNGAWKVQDAYYEKDEQGACGALGLRKHIRLWVLDSSTVIAGVHVDHVHIIPLHVVHDYEGVEHTVADDMRLTDAKPWRVREDDHFMNNVVNLLHDGITVHNDGYATTIVKQSGAFAPITDGLTPVLLSITNFVSVKDWNNHQVKITATSTFPVRWTIWYSATYTAGTVAPGGSVIVTYPHWTAWIMSVWYQEGFSASRMGVLLCKETDNKLGCVTLSGGVIVDVGDSIVNTLLDIRSIGGVRDTGVPLDNQRLVVYANANYDYLEWALWHSGTYVGGQASPGGTSYATFPDGKFFMLIIARGYQPQYSEGDPVGILLCREDNSILGCITHATGTFVSLSNGAPDIMSQIGAIGGIRDISTEPSDPNPHVLQVYAASGSTAVEGAVWYNGVYSGGDTPYGGTKQINFPHYTFFVAVGARYDKLIWLFCKENDMVWGCAPLRWFP